MLRFFFEEHDQARLDEVEELLAAHAGREDALFVELSEAYESARPAQVGVGEAAGSPPVAPPSRKESAPQVEADARRRPSLIVSGVRRGSAWRMNALEEESQERALEGPRE